MMKKFDLFLIIIAFALVGFGFYFSKMFKADSEFEVSRKIFEQGSDTNLNRYPSQINKDDDKINQQNAINSISNPEPADTFFVKKYVKLKKCVESQDCNFSQADPRSYELEIYKSINVHLQDVSLLSNPLKNKILKSAAKIPDGYVKKTVLSEIRKDKLQSDEWRDLVLDEYISYYNARLIPETIEYLKTYTGEADKIVIHQRIFSEISTGSPKVANALAENLKILLDNSTASFYKSRISNLEDGPIKKNLSREILDYEMLASAG